jgi:hypothetical protein
MIQFVKNPDLYNKALEKAAKHKVGYFIFAPSCSGKSYYLDRASTNDWIDGDFIWEDSGAHPPVATKWWQDSDVDNLDLIDIKADIVTDEVRKMGGWIMGASTYFLRPDAVVLLPWATHKSYALKRANELNSSGEQKIEKLKRMRRSYFKRFKKNKVPVFKSIEEAVKFCEDLYKQGKGMNKHRFLKSSFFE